MRLEALSWMTHKIVVWTILQILAWTATVMLMLFKMKLMADPISSFNSPGENVKILFLSSLSQKLKTVGFEYVASMAKGMNFSVIMG